MQHLTQKTVIKVLKKSTDIQITAFMTNLMRTETDLVLGLKTFTFKYSVLFSTTLPLTVMGNSDDILLYFDIRHYDMNMPYTCLMSHISIADQ